MGALVYGAVRGSTDELIIAGSHSLGVSKLRSPAPQLLSGLPVEVSS